jgi:hypothetical protein
MANTIVLKGQQNVIRKEAKASAAITPGDLVEFGGTNELRVHSTIGGSARKAFALENDLVGQGIDDAYDANDTVQYGVCSPGCEVYARLAATKTCTKGDFLESAGNGRLQPASTPIEQSSIAVALETISVAGSRVRVEVT